MSVTPQPHPIAHDPGGVECTGVDENRHLKTQTPGNSKPRFVRIISGYPEQKRVRET